MLLSRSKSYTFQEFKHKDLIKEMNRIDNILNHIKKNKRLYLKLVITLAIVIMGGYINPSLCFAADVNNAIDKINSLGKELWKLITVIGYWVVLVVTAKGCIQEALNGNNRNVGAIVTKGVMIMAIIYFLPELFDMMKSIVE